MTLRVKVDDSKVQKALKDLARKGAPRAMASALNGVAFHIREGEAEQVGRVFDFSGPSTRSFLASPNAFLVDKASPRDLTTVVKARDKSNDVLALHEKGGRVTDDDKRTLKLGSKVAVPINVKRNARGRVAPSRTPGALASNPRVFITEEAILERKKKGANPEVLYALKPAIEDKPRLEFFETARRTAIDTIEQEAKRAVERYPLGGK